MKEKILVVDDNPANLKLASDVLVWEGYDVTRAVDAEEALTMVTDSPPAAILMDIELPGMDGLTLTRQLKNDPATRDIRVIALTAYAMNGDEEKALAAGCDAYFMKPINTRTLGAEVARILHPSPDSTSS